MVGRLNIHDILFLHLAQEMPCGPNKGPEDYTGGYGSGQNRDPRTGSVDVGKTDPDRDKRDKAEICSR